MKCKDCPSMVPSETMLKAQRGKFICNNWLSPLNYVTPDTECPFKTP